MQEQSPPRAFCDPHLFTVINGMTVRRYMLLCEKGTPSVREVARVQKQALKQNG